MIGRVQIRHRRVGARDSLNTVDASTPPELDLRRIRDGASTHIHRWPFRHGRLHLHVTPTSASWLDLVECWSSLPPRRELARGSFHSTDTLERTITDHTATTNAARKALV